MRRRAGLVSLLLVAGLCLGADLFACGDKFLVAGRGTRYQRPKNARAASVLIYANPATGLPAALGKLSVDSVLKHEGHRATTVEAPEQLSAIVASGRFDVVLVASADAESVERVLGTGPDAPVVVSLCVKALGVEPASARATACLKTPPKEGALLEAIDRAVERHDQNVKKAQART